MVNFTEAVPAFRRVNITGEALVPTFAESGGTDPAVVPVSVVVLMSLASVAPDAVAKSRIDLVWLPKNMLSDPAIVVAAVSDRMTVARIEKTPVSPGFTARYKSPVGIAAAAPAPGIGAAASGNSSNLERVGSTVGSSFAATGKSPVPVFLIRNFITLAFVSPQPTIPKAIVGTSPVGGSRNSKLEEVALGAPS
jgi:hypothetical protein